jgi:hypothetical protein
MKTINSSELKDLLANRGGANSQLSFLEPFTWDEDASFVISFSDEALAFYRLNPIRMTVQYLARDEDSLLKLLNNFSHKVTIKLPPTLTVPDWKEWYIYQSLKLDMRNWAVPFGLDFSWGKLRDNVGDEFNHNLTGPERILLRTLEDCTLIVGEKKNGFGLCAFRMIDQTYRGMYLFNQGLSVKDFSCLITQALSHCRGKGAIEAYTIVNTNNKAANFLHESLGFKPFGPVHRVWSNFHE